MAQAMIGDDTIKEVSVDDKITSIRKIANAYYMRMWGYELNSSQDKWVKKNDELAGEKFISMTTGILNSHAEPSNLISSKPYDRFVMDFADAFHRVNTMALNDESIPQENYRAVIKMFKDSFSSIGHITTGSKDFLSKYNKEEPYKNNEVDY